MISIGSYRVFSAHSPALGVWSQGSQGFHHAFFDLGPLLFWLLAIPVHLDPNQGAKWGSALVCGVALSLAIEAVWSIKGWPACVALALAAADVGWQTHLFVDLVWNPDFGLVFLMAAVAIAWVVAAGKFGWWPVLVLFASVAAQSHLLFVIPAVALVVTSPVIAGICGHRPRRWRWLLIGGLVTLACWIVPVGQEIFGHPGNVSLILDSGSGHARAGFGFGLHALATAGWPRPIWVTEYPYLAAIAYMPQYLEAHTTVWAFIALIALLAIAVSAWMTKRRHLAALAAIALVFSLGTTAGFGMLPKDHLVVVGYLGDCLWFSGVLLWIVLLWAAGDVVIAGLPRAGRLRATGTGRVVAEFIGVMLLAIVGVEALLTQVPAARNLSLNVRTDRSLNQAVDRAVERELPPGPVVVEVQPSNFGPTHGFYAVDYWGIASGLLSRGWQPGLNESFFGSATGLTAPPNSHWPVVRVTVSPSTRTIVSVRKLR
jgi:hypothetical protein